MPRSSIPPASRIIRAGILIFSFVIGHAQDWSAPLPPEIPWHGQSENLIAADDDPWITPAEKTGLTRIPRYGETVAWLQKLTEATAQVKMVSLGKSPEMRDIWLVVVSKEGAMTVADLKSNGRPTVLAQAGIHPGEIDGKDAGMMLLRDLTVAGSYPGLLDSVNLLFIPILNVDGHERLAPYGRINQRGPAETGWRTTGRNLNLNRDYAKIDSREMRLLVAALNQWEPDLYLDIHVTDGIDYQYDITFGYTGQHGLSPNGARWLDERLTPTFNAQLSAWGHIPGPLVFAIDDQNPRAGIVDWMATPRFSNGYGDARHLPTVLVENHSLKSFRQRVLGTYVLLRASLRLMAVHGRDLQRAVAADRTREPKQVALDWQQT
ncbi:MAG: M14 family metallopeptidase, partial [Candidatus Neomarinimicrobiota bacterium]